MRCEDVPWFPREGSALPQAQHRPRRRLLNPASALLIKLSAGKLQPINDEGAMYLSRLGKGRSVSACRVLLVFPTLRIKYIRPRHDYD